jgi:hypothetical protein
MTQETPTSASLPISLTNGAGAAAILAAGVGCFALGTLAVIADKSAAFKQWMIFYKPTGALSGVTTTAIVLWLLSWAILDWRWKASTVALGRINFVAFGLLALGLLLTFPPFGDIF